MSLTSHTRSKSGPINLLNSYRVSSPGQDVARPLDPLLSPLRQANRPLTSQKIHYTSPPVHTEVVRINVRKTKKLSTKGLFSDSAPVSMKKQPTDGPLRTNSLHSTDFLFGSDVREGVPRATVRSVKRYKLTRKSTSSRTVFVSQFDAGKPTPEEKPIPIIVKQPSFPSLIAQENRLEERGDVTRLSRRPSTHLSALFADVPAAREKPAEPAHHLQVVTTTRKPTQKLPQRSALLQRLNLTKEL